MKAEQGGFFYAGGTLAFAGFRRQDKKLRVPVRMGQKMSRCEEKRNDGKIRHNQRGITKDFLAGTPNTPAEKQAEAKRREKRINEKWEHPRCL